MLKKYKFENWIVAFRHHDPAVLYGDEPFAAIKNPLLFWAADPFVVHEGDDHFVFAELYNRLTYKGDIRYCIIRKDGTVTRWKKALHTGKHLSFPYIYRKNGVYYMVPEASKAGTLKIYRALSFPNKWVEEKVLARDVRYADSIFLDETHILTYDNHARPRRAIVLVQQDGAWVERQNVEDPTVIFRPAGKAFVFENETYLPFQDSSNGEYGGCMRFSKVELRDDEFKISEDVLAVRPERLKVDGIETASIVGVHTYNFEGDIEVIDVKELTPNMFSLIGYCIRKLLKR